MPTPDRIPLIAAPIDAVFSETQREQESELALQHGLSRRELIERGLLGLLMAGGVASLLGGCASNKAKGSQAGAALPNTKWPMEEVGREQFKPIPNPIPNRNVVAKPLPEPSNVIARSAWAGGPPVTSRMNRAERPFYRITVHHDGTTAFTSTSRDDAARRIEKIRQAHLNRKGEPFGDIGYHYLIDPAGRVWQGRDTAWQGAHVAGQNPGNLGICVLGNYNLQQPNTAQQAAVDRFVRSQMSRYGVGINQIKTHRELAQTECPGRGLQGYMLLTRQRGMSATA